MSTSMAARPAQTMSEWESHLSAFRAQHPPKHIAIGPDAWSYVATGTGPPSVLLLPGGIGTAESSFTRIEQLSSFARVIAPTIPSLDRVGQVCDGLVSLLDTEGIERTHVFGHSLGAGVAHVLVRRHPDRIDRVALSSFGLYTPTHQRLVKAFLRLPAGLLAAYYRRAAVRLVRNAEPGEAEFLRTEMEHLLSDPQRGLRQLHLLEDLFDHHREYGLDTPIDRPSRVLIIAARDDRGFSAVEREALLTTYPGAIVHLHPSGGHWASIGRKGAYENALETFLRCPEVA
jgi:pimeloyl-ACP methyl ester carboxylesterase